jgi:hypothetical protein
VLSSLRLIECKSEATREAFLKQHKHNESNQDRGHRKVIGVLQRTLLQILKIASTNCWILGKKKIRRNLKEILGQNKAEELLGISNQKRKINIDLFAILLPL